MEQEKNAEASTQLVRPEQASREVDVAAAAPDFAPDTPAKTPKFEIPDLDLDAMGLPPDTLASQVPTLGEAVTPTDPGQDRLPAEAASAPPPLAVGPQDEAVPADEATPAQAQGPLADTWVVQMQMRIDKLSEDVRELNDRLDRFEKKPKV